MVTFASNIYPAQRVIMSKERDYSPIIISPGSLAEHYRGPLEFDYLIDSFPSPPFSLREYQTPLDQRWTADKGSHPAGIWIGEWLDPAIGEFMDRLTELANQPEAVENEEVQRVHFNLVRQVLERISLRIPAASGQVLGIVRAGAVAAKILHPEEKILFLDMKRLPWRDGSFAVGIRDPWGTLAKIKPGGYLEVDEIFLASGLTMVALLQLLAEQGKLPAAMTIAAPFLAQPGAEWVLQVAKEQGIELTIVGARLYWQLDKNLYVLDESSRRGCQKLIRQKIAPCFAGGDAGDFLAPFLPPAVARYS